MSKPNATLTTGYVDAASGDAFDAIFYGGEGARSLFGRKLRKHTWHTRITAPMKSEGQADSPSFKFSKTPDFVEFTWVEVTLPKITVKEANNGHLTWRIAYTWNLAHHIWKEGSLTFNDLTAQAYDSTMLDFIRQFRTDPGKWSLYQKMIGNTASLQNFSSELPEAKIKLPTPYYYARDSSYALPLCCCTLNTVCENFTVETDLGKLIRVQKNTAADVENDAAVWVDQKVSTVDFSAIVDVAGGKPFEVPMSKAWAKYVLITDPERNQHQDETREVGMEQFQKANGPKAVAGEHRLEFHFTNPMKALFFGFQNKTSEEYNNRSNYSDNHVTGGTQSDPCGSVSLIYENDPRFSNVAGEWFEMEEWRHAARGSSETGLHFLSYCNHLNDLEVTGSSNYSNLVTSFVTTCTEPSAAGSTYSWAVRGLSAHRCVFRSSTFGFPGV